MTTNFKVGQIGNYQVDIDDILIRREYFNDGTLWAWGSNTFFGVLARGQLGDGTTVNKSSPVTTAGGGINWKQVAGSTGGYHTAAIKTDGTLWTCGYNINGQLGDNTTVSKSSPATTVAGGTNWKQVACGYRHTAAIKTDGTLWTWGLNAYGQLGDNTTVSKLSPVTTVAGGTNWKQVTCGQGMTAAIKTDGTLWTCGYNKFGQLGDNTTVSKSSPNTTIAGGTNWKQITCGHQYSIAAIKTDGTLWTWGYNFYGQLGDNTTVDKSSPVQVSGGGTNWKQVSCGNFHTAAIKTDGTLWIWGYDGYGQLGDNTTVAKSSPITTVAGGTNWKQVACGNQTAAIKTDGTLWTWGQDTYGQLGDNTVVPKSSPITTVAGGTNWKQVSCGLVSTFAITDLTIGTY